MINRMASFGEFKKVFIEIYIQCCGVLLFGILQLYRSQHEATFSMGNFWQHWMVLTMICPVCTPGPCSRPQSLSRFDEEAYNVILVDFRTK